ncbi:MAG: PQQ-like beta-propeller repeat protein [Verrucomicrobiae bacterium]|nr:PQQ-like beta-propeller repeat protein [Verrucomicrobiae bacterium]
MNRERKALTNPLTLCTVLVLHHLLSGTALADWPQMLGPHRDGKATVDGVALLDSFSEDGPKVAWKHKVGEGFAGPVVANGKVFIFHRDGNKATLDSLDALLGKVSWTFTYTTDYRDSFGFDGGPRSAPTVDGGQVFLYGAEGQLHCVDETTGKGQWSVDLVKEVDSAQGFFGRSSAPLVTGNVVIVCGGGEKNGKRSAVFAFDRKTGKLAWQAIDDEADYASPVLGTFHNKPVVVCFLRTGLALIDPATGAELYTERFRSEIHASVNAASPVLLNDNGVFLSSCYGVGAGVWQVTPDLKAKSLWKRGDQLDCHYATPVAEDGYLYGFHGRQESGTELRCIRASDGEVQWKTARMPAGSLLIADEKLLVLTEKGELIIAPLSPKQFMPVTRGQVLAAETRALPACSGGFFYCRDRRQLVCIDLRSSN